MKYKKFFTTRHYSLAELVRQAAEIKKHYPKTVWKCKKGSIELKLALKPTTTSVTYTIKVYAKQNSTTVNIFVVEPKVDFLENGKKVPHLYSNGSLCLFYPPNNEFNYKDLWSETLIPWTSLWLFYYEVWKETGEWLGGGIHGKKCISPEI